MDEPPAKMRAAMGDKIGFDKARDGIGLVGQGPDWDRLAHARHAPGLRSAPMPAARPDRLQPPVNRGRAHRQNPLAHRRLELEMTMPLQRVYQHWDQSLEPLAAHTVRRLP